MLMQILRLIKFLTLRCVLMSNFHERQIEGEIYGGFGSYLHFARESLRFKFEWILSFMGFENVKGLKFTSEMTKTSIFS